MSSLLAATDLGKIYGLGPLGRFYTGNPDKPISLFTATISTAFGVLTVCAGLYFAFQIFSGAIQWLGSSGEKQILENAKKRITNAIVGLLIVVLAFGIISLVGLVFGIDLINLEPLIKSLGPS